MLIQDKVWLGTQESFDGAVMAVDRLGTVSADSGSSEPTDSSCLINMIGSLAVISIEGSLLNRYLPPFALSWGIVGYDNIREALTIAANSPEVDRILLAINSNGGAAAGVEDLANYIDKLKETMPVYTYTGGAMNSAAYWLGCQGEKIFATKTSIVGSIGAYQVVYDESKALSDQGIKGYVIRFGDNKALINGVEPISKAALAEQQKMVDALGGMFVDNVAQARGVTAAYVRANYGDGSVFLGAEALSKGMVTDLGNFDTAVSAILSVPSRTNATTYRGVPMKTSAQAAHTPSSTQVTAAQPDQTQPEAVVAAVTLTSASVTSDKPEPISATISYLEGKLDAAKAESAEANQKLAALADIDAKLAAAEQAVQAMTANANALAAIVVSQISRMSTALNTQTSVDAADFTSLVATYNDMATKFESRLPVGGIVNHNTQSTAKPVAQGNVHPLFAMQTASAATYNKG